MQLRNLNIPYAQPAVFAPMAGFTDAACRHLMADHGAAWTVSEMASAKAITFGDDKSVRLLRDKASHGIYAVQLFGAEPETMAQAIRIIQEKGVQFDILDINMGCPAPKITSSGAGSKLMQDPELCGRMVAAARGALGPDKPLTVKMRIGWDAEQLTGVAVARQCEANGADLIAVHGRTREQMYIPPIDVDAITEIRKAVGIPVLANGDITTAEGAKQILEQTGCAGVMIGRGALGDPWLFERINAVLTGQPEPGEPSLNARMSALRAQIYEMCEEKGGAQGFVLVFDRGRHIAGQNFRCIVVQRRGGHGVGADIGPGVGDVPGDQAKRMGQQGGIRRVLTQAFLPHAAHQRPPRNILHAPQKSVKRV